MRSLLLGAYHAGLKVETLHCGLVSWRVLQQDTETLAHMEESLSNLKNLRTRVQHWQYRLRRQLRPFRDGIWKWNSVPHGSREHLSNTSSPQHDNLEDLQIWLPTHPRSPGRVVSKTFVDEHRWPSLKTAKIPNDQHHRRRPRLLLLPTRQHPPSPPPNRPRVIRRQFGTTPLTGRA